MERDFERACRWFGPMPFADFLAGYEAMDVWLTTQPFRVVATQATKGS